MSPAHFAFGFAAASLELPLPVLDEGLDEELGEALELSLEVLPVLDEGLVEELGELLVLAPLGDVAESELMLPLLLPLPLAPDAPEELSLDELPVPLAPALVPALPPAPVPCAQAAVAKATMAAVTAALMSFRFIFVSSRVGRGTAADGDARTMP